MSNINGPRTDSRGMPCLVVRGMQLNLSNVDIGGTISNDIMSWRIAILDRIYMIAIIYI